MKKLIILILIIVAIVFGIPKQEDRGVSAGFVPGDVLYFLDTSWEWIQLNLLTFTDEGKVKLEIQYIDERMAEMEEIQRKGELTIEKAEKITDDYNRLVEEVDEDIEKIRKAKEDVDELIKKIQNLSERHRIVIERITEEAPEKTSEFLEKAINFGDGLLNRF